jgi:N6-adenosine-specific RNA methylase IME4
MGVKREDAEEYTRSLGQIVAGSWRQIALAKRLGVPKALGLTTEQWVHDRLGGYVKMSIAERREVVRNLTAEDYSAREIAEIVGVSHDTAATDVRNLTTIDAVAVLAADDAVQKQIAAETDKADKIAARIAKRNGQQIEDGCTVEDLRALIAAGKKFSVIYADPPWEFKVYSGKGKQRSAERHYDTASLDDIKALPVGNLAAADCALFLWCVMPELPGALDVIHAWGFEYKTAAFVWIKTNENDKFIDNDGSGLHWGMGYWTRANAELCLLATKGAPKRLDMGVHQVIISPVAEHSRKPDKAQQRIEQLLGEPTGETHLELFGRRASPQWTVWGNEVSRSLFHHSIPQFGGVDGVAV